MKKKFYVHVGLHKTASTYIQSFLNLNLKLFLKKNIMIPQYGRVADKSIINHSNIIWDLINDDRFRKIDGSFNDLIGEIKLTNQDILISSEDFEYLSSFPKKINYFESTLINLDYEIVYIGFFRNEISHSLSLFATLKQYNENINFFKFTIYILMNGFYKMNDWIFYFDLQKFLKKWNQNSFFKVNILNFSKHKENIINAFLKSINSNLLGLSWKLPITKINTRPKKNDSLIKYFFAILIYSKFTFFNKKK